MTHTIMLIPIGESVGLTTASVSLIELLRKNNKSIIFFKPFLDKLHESLGTCYILEKYFSIPYIEPIIYDSNVYTATKEYVQRNIKDTIDLYYSYKNKYDIIFIEGVKSNKSFCNSLNLKFLRHTDAEVIFYSSGQGLDLLKKFSFNKLCNIKNNILGVINNFCNISITSYNDIFFLNCLSNRSNDFYTRNSKFIITYIPWNRRIQKFSIEIIFKLIQIKNIIKKKHKIHLIDSFVLYDKYIYHYSYNMCHTVLLVSFSVFIDRYYDIINVTSKISRIHSIILTDCTKEDILIVHLLKKQMQCNIIFFYTHLTFYVVISIIHNLKTSVITNITYFDLLLKHIMKYINRSLRLVLSFRKRDRNTNISPVMFQKYLIEKSKNIRCHILLPEGTEERIINAASIVANLDIANFTLLGDMHVIYNIAKTKGFNISKNINIVDPKDIYKNYVEKFFLLRSHKGITWKTAEKYVQDNMILGSLLLRDDQVDGIVCGVRYTTAHVLRTAIQLVGINNMFQKDYSVLSSAFFMLLRDTVLIYSDCAVNINPSAQELFAIALNASDLATLFDIDPKIAMLSYSTGNSGVGDTVEKVRQATNLIKKKYPHLIIEGPIQYDAAINSKIANIKLSSSPLNGLANVFIFPDLNSGNITYKAVQQSLRISSIGPILQGLMKPVNDLSRGATVNDIIYTILITAIQSQKKL